jgi:hypothetical protein
MKQWLPAILALIVGLVVGWILPRHESPSTQSDALSAGSGPEFERPRPVLPPTSGTGHESVHRRSDQEANKTAESEPVVEPHKLPEAIVADVKGEGVLRGVAMNADGSPAAGVALVANLRVSVTDSYPNASALRENFCHRCVTGEDGTFTFTGLQQQYLTIQCEAPTLFARDLDHDFNHLALRAGDFARLLILRKAALEVTVLDEKDEEISIASVVAVVEDGTRTSFTKTWTNLDRTLFVLPGQLTVHASSLADSSLRTSILVEVKLGETTKVTLKLVPPAGLYIDVTLPELWYDRTNYYLLPQSEAADFKISSALTRTKNGAPRTILGEHAMVFPDLAAGDYVLIVGNYVEFQRLPVHFGGGTERQTLKLEPLDPSKHLLVRIHDMAGAIRFDAKISALRPMQNPPQGVTGAQLMDNEGTWWLLIAPDLTPPIMEVLIKATVPRVGAVEKQVDATLGVVNDLFVSEVASVKIHVSGLTNELLNRLELTLIPKGAAQPLRFGGAGYTQGSGTVMREDPRIAETALFNDVPLGEAEICIRLALHPVYLRPELDVLRQTVNVGRDTTEFSVTLPPLHSVRIRVNAEDKITTISLSTLAWSEAAVKDGAATWPSLPAGDYTLYESRTGEMKLHVEGATEVDWKPTPFNCIRLSSLDKDGVLAAAGFEAGDCIVSIDGQSYEGYDQLSAALSAARKAESVRIQVERNGEPAIVQIEGPKLNTGLRHYRYSCR